MYSRLYLIGLLLYGALASSASDGDNTGSRSKASACRERLIVLEDEYEDLSNRYKNVLEDYKEVKQELREHLSRERAAEELVDEIDQLKLELADKKDGIQKLDKALRLCDNKKDNCLVDLQLNQEMFSDAQGKLSALEKKFNQEDCSGIKRDMNMYRNQAEQCLIDRDELEQDIQRLKKEVEVVPWLEETVEELKEALKSNETEVKSLRAELNATKSALHSLLDSLDSHLQYLTLKDIHEKELFPFWLDQLLARGKDACHQIYTNSWIPFYDKQRESAIFAQKTVIEEGRRLLDETKNTIEGFYQKSVLPAWNQADIFLEQHIPSWKNLIYKLQVSSSRTMSYLHVEAKNARLAFFRFQNVVQAMFLTHVSRVESLRPMATKPFAEAFFWALISITGIPIILYILSSLIRLLMYLLRPGTASVVIMNESVIVQSIQTCYKYTFKNKDILLQALEGSGVLQALGPSVLALVAAEMGMQPMSTEFQLRIDTLIHASPIFDIVRPGPGRKSRLIAAKKRRELFITTLAAVFKDSDMNLRSVIKIFANSSAPEDVEENNGEEAVHDDISIKKASNTEDNKDGVTLEKIVDTEDSTELEDAE